MILTIILVILLTASVYVNWNLYRKVDLLEKYSSDFLTELTMLKNKIAMASKVMNDADTRGGFSSDDEIGTAFSIIKDCIDYMDGKENNLKEYDDKQ